MFYTLDADDLTSCLCFSLDVDAHRCGDYQAESPCLSEGGGADAARFYDITVVVTDSSGNAGEATCTVVAVPEYDCYPGAGKGCKSSYKYRPTREALVTQLASSAQRYELDQVRFVYNTGEDASSVSQAATLSPRSKGKSSKKSTKR